MSRDTAVKAIMDLLDKASDDCVHIVYIFVKSYLEEK